MPGSRHAWPQVITCWTATLALAATVNAGGPRLPWKSKTSVEHLAEKIDCLEKHIETYGTIVPKTPDVWGEARLTKYRVEFEEEMEAQKDAFEDTINAAITRTDQAFLTSTLALQAAISGRGATQSIPTTRFATTRSTSYLTGPRGRPIFNLRGDQAVGSTNETSTPVEGETHTPILIPAPPTDTLSNVAELQSVTVLSERENHGFDSDGVALEPTISLDQRARYLNHLHQLRRNNDGDDRSDSPGYGLHLVRIPISVLPGRKTEAGYGAEITVTAKPYIHDKLLESTFRELVINDLVDQFSFPLVKFLDSAEGQKILTAWIESQKEANLIVEDLQSLIGSNLPNNANNQQTTINDEARHFIQQFSEGSPLNFKDAVPKQLDSVKKSHMLRLAAEIENTINRLDQRWDIDLRSTLRSDLSSPPEQLKAKLHTKIFSASEGMNKDLIAQTIKVVSIAPSRRAQQPFPNSQCLTVFGVEQLAPLAILVNRLKGEKLHEKHLHLLDVQKILNEEFRAAYRILESRPEIWSICSRELAVAVRESDFNFLENAWNQLAEAHPPINGNEHSPVLVWGILVESALLNERLIEDMKQMQAAKNCVCINTDWLPYYMPNPEPHVVESFRQYVECRWPIQVFAVDPITSDQNVADSVSIRREMQLALSVALASGRINVQKFLRFARSLAIDMETISLNQTVVGFAHGGDTFGWRFYPRVQVPPSRGNFVVATRELLIGGYTHDQMLRTRRLEPGIRECTAIVLMPQFVPYAIFDTRTNWFKLDNPAKREFDLEESMVVSRNITTMQQLSQACVTDQHLYRPEEVRHLQTAVNQLEKRLPLQTSWVQLPFENPLGGFEFFNGGTPDLSPELHGFYGEPGLRPDGTVPTSIFVVGNNFSVHETRVIVGNRALDENEFQLLSRQVIQVTAKVPFEIVGDQVDIHVATPYGVSNHLLVPVLPTKAQVEATAAAKAISDHEAARHLDRFDWKKAPNFRIGVTTKAGAFQTFDYIPSSVSPFAELTLARQDLSDKNVNSSLSELDKQLSPTPVVGKLIFQISVSVDGQPQPVGQFAIGPVSLALGQKLDATAVNELDKQLRTKLSSAIPPRVETAKLTFTGFVRLPALYNTETVQLEKPFEARLDLFEK